MKLILTTLMLLGAAFAYCEDAPKVSDPAITTYEKAISDIDTKALVEKRKARDVAVKALDSAITKAMKANDLDKAVALKGAKEKIGNEWKEKGDLANIASVSISIKVDVDTLENGKTISPNRDYKFNSISDELKGLNFAKLDMKSPVDFDVKVTKAGILYIAFNSKADLTVYQKMGFELSNKTITSDFNAGKFSVMMKHCTNNETIRIYADDWISAIPLWR